MVAAFLFVFIPSMGEYITPSLVGGTDGYMFGQAIAAQFVGGALNWQVGSVLSIFLLAVVLFLTFATSKFLRQGGGADGMKRAGRRHDVTMSRNGRRALLAFFVLFLVFLYLPTVMLIIFSFNDSASVSFPLSGFTTGWYEEAFHNDQVRSSFWASIRVAAGTAVVATIIALLVSYAARQAELSVQGSVSPASCSCPWWYRRSFSGSRS